jgi:hypothetical protein
MALKHNRNSYRIEGQRMRGGGQAKAAYEVDSNTTSRIASHQRARLCEAGAWQAGGWQYKIMKLFLGQPREGVANEWTEATALL